MAAAALLTIVQLQFTLGIWTDVSADVIRPIQWQRGIANNSPKDNVAGIGTLDLSLRNDETNSAGLLGLYSMNHPNCRAGFTEGTPIRVLYSSGSLTERVRWTGKIYSALPDVGLYRDRRVHVHAEDVMGDLADTTVLEVERQIEKDEVEVLNAVLDSLPTSAQPIARDFDPADSLFPVSLDDLGEGEPAWGVCEKIATSARACLYPLGDGTLKLQSFGRRSLEVSRYTFPDTVLVGLDIPSSRENCFNLVRATTHPRTFVPPAGPGVIVLATHVSDLEIAPGETVEFFLTYQDPDRPELKIGGTDWIDPPEPLVDYLFTDGTSPGNDITADVDVVADFFPSAVKFTITNDGYVTAHRELLRVRGRGIYDQNPVTVKAYTPMPRFTRDIEIDMPYQDDAVFAQAVADLLEASYRSLADQVNSLTFFPQDSDALIEQALTLEIGQVVETSETVALPDGVTAYIQSIAMTLTADDVLICRLGLAPRIVQDELRESDAENIYLFDRLDSFSAAPEDRIGFMVIGFSEIGVLLLSLSGLLSVVA